MLESGKNLEIQKQIEKGNKSKVIRDSQNKDSEQEKLLGKVKEAFDLDNVVWDEKNNAFVFQLENLDYLRKELDQVEDDEKNISQEKQKEHNEKFNNALKTNKEVISTIAVIFPDLGSVAQKFNPYGDRWGDSTTEYVSSIIIKESDLEEYNNIIPSSNFYGTVSMGQSDHGEEYIVIYQDPEAGFLVSNKLKQDRDISVATSGTEHLFEDTDDEVDESTGRRKSVANIGDQLKESDIKEDDLLGFMEVKYEYSDFDNTEDYQIEIVTDDMDRFLRAVKKEKDEMSKNIQAAIDNKLNDNEEET